MRRPPLQGVRVLAAEQMQSLPYATQLMAHLGADVLKIEQPDLGDSGRAAQPYVVDEDGRRVGATFLRNNLFKRSLSLDLKTEAGRDVFKRLVPRFDVVAENFKAGTMERFGLGYEVLAALNPRLVFVSVSGFGALNESAYATWPAYGGCAEAMAGFMEADRVPGERPRIGAAGALGDIGTALFVVIGTLAALRQRDRDDVGSRVDVAMLDSMIAIADMIPFMWSMGVPVKRNADGTSTVTTGSLSDSFAATDGFFIVQVAREEQFRRFAKVIGKPDWAADPRFATRSDWQESLETMIRPAVESWAASRTKLEAARALCDEGIPAAPCNSAQDIVSDPSMRSRKMVLEVRRPDSNDPMLVSGNPIRLAGIDRGREARWPRLGEDTDDVLKTELGLSAREIKALRDGGAV